MSLLEHAAVEAAKKFAENEENRTDTRGVVKASKVFPVVSVFSVLMGIAMALAEIKAGRCDVLCAGGSVCCCWAYFC